VMKIDVIELVSVDTCFYIVASALRCLQHLEIYPYRVILSTNSPSLRYGIPRWCYSREAILTNDARPYRSLSAGVSPA
jgi:hypothetical protein